jgi:hypothetical protein
VFASFVSQRSSAFFRVMRLNAFETQFSSVLHPQFMLTIWPRSGTNRKHRFQKFLSYVCIVSAAAEISCHVFTGVYVSADLILLYNTVLMSQFLISKSI